MKPRPLDVRSQAGKALLELTREQFSYWENQLREATSGDFIPSHSMHYWYIMSTLALGDNELKVVKKKAEEALPKASTEAGRRYLYECEKFGLTRTITTKGVRYAALTDGGERAIANTLGRWITEFAKVRRVHVAELRVQATERQQEYLDDG
jgi:hypothetical protein